jgi:predicted permease
MVILSDAFWRRRFGGDRGLVGRAMRLDGEIYTVAGVMPDGFDVILPSDASVPPGVEVWTPFRDDLAALPRDMSYIRTIARLRPGATVAQARAELAGIAEGLRAEFREYATQGLGLDVAALHADAVRDVRPVLLALFGGVGLVVLIACANVANLLLARATRRQREIGLRAALGASRARIVRQLLCESLVLAGAGGALGLAVGWGGLRLLLALRPANLIRILPAGLAPGVVAFTFGLSLITGLLCGLAPALALAKHDLFAALKEGVRGGTPGRTRPQRLLVLAEVALGFILLVGAGLLVRTFVKLLGADPGFRVSGVLTFQVALPDARYPEDAARQRLFRRLQENVEALPGVEAVGAVSHLPLDDYPNWYEYYWRDGAPAAEQNALMADHRAILPGYFASLGAELVAGRDLTAADDALHPNVVVVDESLARRTWPGEDPLGKLLNVTFIHNGSFDPVRAAVVGVVRHVRYRDLTSDVRGQVYVPYLQSAREQLTFTVRTGGDPGALAGSIRREVSRLDPDLALSRVRPLSDYVAQARQGARFTTAVAGALAGLALLLAAIGIYGVLAYSVAQRTREIGVRIALGGRPRDILWLVAGQAFGLIGAGLAAGMVGSLALTGLLRRLLYGVEPHDVPTILGAGLILAAAGALAAYLPARRALGVDPMVALRRE